MTAGALPLDKLFKYMYRCLNKIRERENVGKTKQGFLKLLGLLPHMQQIDFGAAVTTVGLATITIQKGEITKHSL